MVPSKVALGWANAGLEGSGSDEGAVPLFSLAQHSRGRSQPETPRPSRREATNNLGQPKESMEEEFVRSDSKPPGRRIWTRRSPVGLPSCLLVFLDAELYLERVGAAHVLKQLEDERRIPPVVSVFVSSHGAAARHCDYVCDSAFAHFLSSDLLPHALAQHPTVNADGVVLIGLSLSGLAAAHAALTTSQFRAAVCQSPSLWWAQERLASSLPSPNGIAPAFWVSVGNLETESGVSHPPSALFQGTSQLDSCERGAAALRLGGYAVAYRVFPGGHDPACWRDDLALAIPWSTSA